MLRRQRARKRREDVLTRGGEVVVEDVAVREHRHCAGTGQRADADHVRQRGRVARERPGAGRVRLVRVPDRGDEHGALAVRVLDRALLELRVGVAGGVERVADTAEAEVDHLRAVGRRPADRGRLRRERDRPVRTDDLPNITFYMVVHRALRNVPRIAAVADFLLETLEGTQRQRRG